MQGICNLLSYRKTFSIRRTKSQSLNVSRLVSSCSCLCPIHWNQMLSRKWRCSWSSTNKRCSSYSWVINKSIAYQAASYVRDSAVIQCATANVSYKTKIYMGALYGVICMSSVIAKFSPTEVTMNKTWEALVPWVVTHPQHGICTTKYAYVDMSSCGLITGDLNHILEVFLTVLEAVMISLNARKQILKNKGEYVIWIP